MITMKTKVTPMHTIICLQCKQEKKVVCYGRDRKTRKFCSPECHYAHKPTRQHQAKKRIETFITKYGGFDPVIVQGAVGAKQRSLRSTEHMKKVHNARSEEQRLVVNAKISNTLMGHKHSPETKEKILRNTLKSSSCHPNKFESRGMDYLNQIYPGKFVYTGNGTMIVNHRSADAFSKDLNTIVLFNGWYWHLKKFGLEVTDENKRAVEKVESAPFLVEGYKVMFIWEDEFNRSYKKAGI